MIAAEFKDSLMTALHDSVDRLNTGAGPDQAVAKAASAAEFNTEQTKRLCETFNTARTLYHFQSTPQEKEASFPLCNQQNVLHAVFTADAAAEKGADVLSDYTEYEDREWMARDGLLVEANAEPELWAKDAVDEFDLPSIEGQARRAYKIIDTYRTLSKDAQNEADQADLLVGLELTKLAKALANTFDMDGPDVWDRFNAVCADAPMFAKLGEYLPERLKTAEVGAPGNVIDTSDINGWIETFQGCQKLAERAANTRAGGITMGKEAEAFEQQFLQKVGAVPETDYLDDMLSDFSEGVKQAQTSISKKVPNYNMSDLFMPTPSTEEDIKRQREMSTATVSRSKGPGLLSGALEGARGGIGAAAGKYVETGLESVFDGADQQKANKSISERLRNQQREVLLQDLMISDPFISEADPQQVTQAYQTVMQLAPEVSTQKEIVRAILRQAIQSVATSPYDASAYADLEKTIREITGKLPQKPSAQGGVRSA